MQERIYRWLQPRQLPPTLKSSPLRAPGGLWTKYGEPPMNGYQIFLSDPKKAWEDRIRRQNDELWGPLKVAKPNPGHTALKELEAMGVLRFLITQNVDD